MAGHQWANTPHKSGRSSVKELSLNGVSMINSNALSNTFKDHFSTITAWEITQFSGI